MAEDEIVFPDEEIQGGVAAEKPPKPKCNMRLEELSRPKKWLMLGVWKEYHSVWDADRMQRFKLKVQEEFSMTPEETETYFNQLRKHVHKMRSKKAMEKQLKREKALAKQEAYKLFKKRLTRGLRYAFEHQPPAVVSPMLRDLSDSILEILANIHKVNMPKRDSNDKNSIFLICIADWAAKLVSNIYYQVQAYEKTAELQQNVSKVSVCATTGTVEEEEVEEEEEEVAQGGEQDLLAAYE
nr:uncharacterized protein LOC111424086 [Onthophagus taurus]